MIGPFVVFYVLLVVAGVRGALVGGLAWCFVALGSHLLRRKRPPATVVLGTAMLTARTAIAFATGSTFLYFA